MEVPREKAMLTPFVRANVSVVFPGKVLAKRYSQLLKPTRAKFATSMISFGHPLGLGWFKLDRVGLNLTKAQIFAQLSPRFPPFDHLCQLKPTLAKLLCYCYETDRPTDRPTDWLIDWICCCRQRGRNVPLLTSPLRASVTCCCWHHLTSFGSRPALTRWARLKSRNWGRKLRMHSVWKLSPYSSLIFINTKR